MHFGFSYIGLIMLAGLFIPNAFWTKNKPLGYDEYSKNENKILLLLERIGEASVTALSLIFSDLNINKIRPWSVWLLISMLLMLMYELYWIRYFKSEKTMKDFYSSFLGVPVAAFLCLSIYGKNIFLGIAAVILGIGHIGIHLSHRREAEAALKR